jgi:hypothetical protein
MRTLPLLVSVACMVAVGVSPAAGAPASGQGLTVNAQGVLVKDGRPYRGIGVNYFSAFYRHLLDPRDTSYEAGFAALAQARIPFVRLMGGGYWPVEQKLYQQNRAEFFRRFDGVVRAAERHGIGLIPSLFWHVPTVPDLVGEPVNAWGNPGGKTHAYMRAYVQDMVTRYRGSPALWGWEFGNEFNLGADLPNASEWRPPIVPELGTPTSRSEKDEWSYETIRTAFAAFAREVRRYDPDRIVSTGDSLPRPWAWHNWTEKSWTRDTPEQFAAMLIGDNPDPVNVISVHAYGGNDYEDVPAAIRAAAAVAARVRKPLFVGEFGAPGPAAKSEQEFRTLLAAIEQAAVPLAALWNYDQASNDPDPLWNVTATNERGYQLRAIAEVNARLPR